MRQTDERRALYAELRKAVTEKREVEHIRALIKADTIREAVLGYVLDGSGRDVLDESLFQGLIAVLKIARTEAREVSNTFRMITSALYVKNSKPSSRLEAAEARADSRARFLEGLLCGLEATAEADSKHPEADCRLTMLRDVAQYDDARIFHGFVAAIELRSLGRMLQRIAEGDDL